MVGVLRAFLMLRSSSAEWTVSVHRDLESLMEAWKARAAPEAGVGVVHVGFDRPPSRSFEKIAEQHLGRALLTGAARYALPRDFVASQKPIGEVEGLPVFLGMRGWGYLIEANGDESDLHGTPTDIQAPQCEGWVRDFIRINHAAADQLANAAIWSDESYLKNEHLLPNILRYEIGVFRFDRYAMGNEDDPCALARSGPPWLSERRFETMGLSVRSANVLRFQKIDTVEDLSRYSVQDLLRFQNFGRSSIKDIVRCLREAIDRGPYSVVEESEDRIGASLIGCIRQSLGKFPKREQDVVLRRMGLDGENETLQQISEDYHVTRERIRQIENKVIKGLRSGEMWIKLLSQKISGILSEREFPLPLLGIEAVDAWFEGMAKRADAMRYLLNSVCDQRAGIVMVDGIAYLAFLTQDKWETTIREARVVLEGGVGKAWSVGHCQSVVNGLLPENAKEFRSLLWEVASRLCHFSNSNGGVGHLIAYGRGAEQIVEVILNEADRPMHFAEIAKVASSRSGREMDSRRAHQAAAAVGLLLGRGTFGVAKHMPLSMEELNHLAVEAEEIVTDGPDGRQWHTFEIRSALLERGSTAATKADKYVIDIALLKSGNLERLGRMIWAIKAAGDDTEVNRIELRQAIVRLIQQAGRPLRTEEIRLQLVAVRGVSSLFQIAASDPLIRIAPGLWGLNDRDVPIKKSHQPQLRDALVRSLNERGKGIHASELTGLRDGPLGLSVSVIFSLAIADERLRVNQGQYLFLAEWGGPRRESVSEAVERVLTDQSRPMRFEEIVAAVSARIGRTCERNAVSGCLQGLEAVHDPVAGLWSKPSIEVETEDEPPLEEFTLDGERVSNAAHF
jgi:hypothetical protein